MRNTYLLVVAVSILFLLTSCSQSPESSVEKPNESKSNQAAGTLGESFPFGKLPIGENELKGKYHIQTSFFSPRESIKLLKKPITGIEAFQQSLIVHNQPEDTHLITIIALQFPDEAQCIEETQINFSILKNVLTKKNLAIDSFAINTYGDESMGIVFTGKKYPLYLYCRKGTVLLKLNGGEKMQMEELVEALKITISKLQ
ncbi:hypothetical protein KDK77_07280 [bacterium]|nr:hypothetical protein [bacterium]MCP5461823.1 hypothetical protein [bacterium]